MFYITRKASYSSSIIQLGAAYILVAEATTIRNESRVAVQASFMNIHIERDNKILIQPVQGHNQTPWEIQV